jgi:ArsR family transcriptional regulator
MPRVPLQQPPFDETRLSLVLLLRKALVCELTSVLKKLSQNLTASGSAEKTGCLPTGRTENGSTIDVAHMPAWAAAVIEQAYLASGMISASSAGRLNDNAPPTASLCVKNTAYLVIDILRIENYQSGLTGICIQ